MSISLISNPMTLFYFLLIFSEFRCRADQQPNGEDVTRRWHEIEKQIISISGRMSKISQNATWQIYRKMDEVENSLNQVKNSLAILGHQLSSANKAAWLCAVEKQNKATQPSKESDSEWRRCLQTVANELAAKEKELSGVNAKLRMTALPCYLKVDCNNNLFQKLTDPKGTRICVDKGCKWQDKYGCCNPENSLKVMETQRARAYDLEKSVFQYANKLNIRVSKCLQPVSDYIMVLNKEKHELNKCKHF